VAAQEAKAAGDEGRPKTSGWRSSSLKVFFRFFYFLGKGESFFFFFFLFLFLSFVPRRNSASPPSLREDRNDVGVAVEAED